MDSDYGMPALFIRKIESRAHIDDADRAAIASLPSKLRTVSPSTYLLREGQTPVRCGMVLEGFAFRQKLTADGNREIVSVLIPGDFIDLQNLYLAQADHDVQALTRLTIAEFSLVSLRDLAHDRPAVRRALWVDCLIESSIYREWLLNIGRRPAPARLAHLLCEFHIRLQAAGLGTDAGYELPMTQEQLGDAVGLTSVHVNRVLKTLERQGLIRRAGRHIDVTDWERLQSAAHFNKRYLHLDQIAPTPA